MDTQDIHLSEAERCLISLVRRGDPSFNLTVSQIGSRWLVNFADQARGVCVTVDDSFDAAFSNRIVVDLVLRRPPGTTGAAVHAFAGIRFQGESGASSYDNLITTLSGQACGYGINLSNAQIAQFALYLAKDQKIALETTGANTLSYSSSYGGVIVGVSGGFLVQGAGLGTSAGSTLKGYAAAVSDTNNDALQTSAVRLTAGSDWTTAAWRLARVVDGTAVGASLDFLQAGLRVNGAAGFNGATPVGQQSVTGALATDGSASSAQLATAFNSLRTALSALGLVK